MFDGTKQAKMIKRFARRYKLRADIENYDLLVADRTRASYHCAHPQLTRNRKLNDTFYRWQWKTPLGMKRACGYVFLHGMSSRKLRVPETIFVIRRRELEAQLSEFPGQRKQISLDGSVRVTPNKRTIFYFSAKRKFDRAEFRTWLRGKRNL